MSASDARSSASPPSLDEIPIAQAPTGVTANLVDPIDVGNVLIIVSTIFTGFGLLAFVLRFYAKVVIIKKYSSDDWTISVGEALALVVYASNLLGVVHGPVGKHLWDTSVAEASTDDYLLSVWLSVVFVTPALGLMKITILLMYYNLFKPIKWIRVAVGISLVIICGFYGAVTIVLFVYCTPRPGKTWQDAALDGTLTDSIDLSLPTGIVGLITDIWLVVLPVPVVAKLQMPISKKVGVSCVFMTGILACVASAVGTAYRVIQDRTQDYSWYDVRTQTVVQVEIHAGIICACMPSISKLLGHGVTMVCKVIVPRFKGHLNTSPHIPLATASAVRLVIGFQSPTPLISSLLTPGPSRCVASLFRTLATLSFCPLRDPFAAHCDRLTRQSIKLERLEGPNTDN